MSEPVIQITNLVHTYREAGLPPRTVLDIRDWQVTVAEQVLLRGKSGSGKTTLLNLIAGLLMPTAGQVSIVGQDLNRLTEALRDRFRARHIGYIFQTHNLLPFTALENVEMPLAFLGASHHERRKRARETLESVGLESFLHHKPYQLSAGQRLRVAVSRALVARPHILLADEPTAALDQETGLHVMDLLQTMCRESGSTLLIASHDPGLTARFGRIIDLDDTTLHEAIQAPSMTMQEVLSR